MNASRTPLTVLTNPLSFFHLLCAHFAFAVIFGCCCPLCMVCDTAKRMNENIGAICCLAVCSMTAAITGMRTHTRAKYGIEVKKNEMRKKSKK